MNRLSDTTICQIAEVMTDPEDPRGRFSSDRIEVWQTYIGQMISHDIVPTTNIFSDTSVVTPELNLDSLYSNAPPHILKYEPERSFFLKRNGEFDIRPKKYSIDKLVGFDLPRNIAEEALIPESRNDENIIIAQFHSLWLYFHNLLLQKGIAKNAFEARKITTLTFQLVVIEDFLSTVLRRDVFDAYTKENCRFLGGWDNNLTPDFFSLAAFRIGHSMIRMEYALNDHNTINMSDMLRKSKPIKKRDFLDWNSFINYKSPQHALKIDTYISVGMNSIASRNGVIKLVEKNIKAGYFSNLPSGLDLFKLLEKQNMSSAVYQSLGLKPLVNLQGASFEEINGLCIDSLPLWLYILLEAQNYSSIRGAGGLGTLGSILVSEVVLNAIQRSRISVYQNNYYNFDFAIENIGEFGELIKERIRKRVVPQEESRNLSMVDIVAIIKSMEE